MTWRESLNIREADTHFPLCQHTPSAKRDGNVVVRLDTEGNFVIPPGANLELIDPEMLKFDVSKLSNSDTLESMMERGS